MWEEWPTHQPVLLDQVVSYLAPRNGGLYVDGNLGLGGHSAALLRASAPNGRVIGFDWDGEALEMARRNLLEFGDRITFVRRNFAEIKETLAALGEQPADGLLLDLGLSSMQLDAGGRGFSFQRDEPLDMRMDTRRTETAADLVNRASEEELADILFYYGEERQARRIAGRIVEARKRQPLTTSAQLAALVERAVPRAFWPQKIHVATKSFQALRIAVNGELDNLQKVLADLEHIVKPSGRICIISFHSLEDRLVKKSYKGNCKLRVLTAKPLVADERERGENPRARSARMRVAQVIE